MNTYAPYTLIPAMIYLAAMGAFAVAFLVDWIRRFEQIHRYWKHAIAAAAILVSLNCLTIAVAPGEWTMVRIVGFMSLPLLFVRVVGFTMLGTHYCARMGRPSFRLLPQELPLPPAPPSNIPPPANDAGPCMGSVGPDLPPALAEVLAEPIPQADSPSAQAVVSSPPGPRSPQDYLRDVLAVAAVSAIYSALLFLLTKPHIGEMIERAFGVGKNAAEAGTYAPFTVLLVLTFAFGEEIFFRLGIQNFLATYLHWQGNRYWAAVALTSLLWTLGHAGVLDPEWVKLAQIFPVGLMLGWLFRRHGVEACMLAHGLFNVLMIGLSSLLVT